MYNIYMATDDPFATPTPEQNKQALIGEQWKVEMQRRSQDTIRVANPRIIIIKGQEFEYPHGDYFVQWEQGRHRVPIDGTLDTVRYIATTYCREMFVNIINYYGEIKGQELLNRVGKEKPDVLLDKYLENKSVWDKMPRTDDKALMEEIWQQLWIGVVHKFGLDSPESTDPRAGEVDFKTSEEKILENLGDRPVIDTPPVTAADSGTLEPVVEPKKPEVYVSRKERERLAKEVTNND